jgi:cytochrome c-type biogenesis protein CcmH/NrfG
MQEIEALIAKDTANNELKFALAAMHQSQNDRKSAEAVLRSVADKEGDSPDGIKAKGQLAALLLAGGDKKNAQTLIDQVLAKDQRNEQGLLLKASIAIDGRQLDQAIADLRTVLKDVPNSARALLLLARRTSWRVRPSWPKSIIRRPFRQASKRPSSA